MFFHLVSLYALVRIIRPHAVLETGGTPGKSSAFILRALSRNGHGELCTIDLPPAQTNRTVTAAKATEALPGSLRSNWCVRDDLRNRQHLLLGRAQDLLPPSLERLGHVDLFIHDSDHSYAHMLWEFRTAFPFVRSGGYLWSDDILTNTAWRDFCAEVRLPGFEFLSQGVIRKP